MTINEFIKFLKSFKKENKIDGHQELRFLMFDEDLLLNFDEVFCDDDLNNTCYLSFSENVEESYLDDGEEPEEADDNPFVDSKPNNVIPLLTHQKEQNNASVTVEW